MEVPECPVCLQGYDEDEKIIPRVLSCGHSACERCLSLLPRRFSDAISCPACTQLARIPLPQGPSALPKNIDLLRFSSSSTTKNPPKTTTITSSSQSPLEFFPHFSSLHRDWILPSNSISFQQQPQTLISSSSSLSSSSSSFICCFGTTTETLNDCPPHCRSNQAVTLLPISNSSPSAATGELCFRLSYGAQVMKALHRMGDAERNELGFLRSVSLRRGRIRAVYGVWMDIESGCIFLVSERSGGDSWERIVAGGVGHWIGEDRTDAVLGFCLIGLEMCEAVMSLHLEGISIGCLAPSCFDFDDYGHLLFDLNCALELGRRLRKTIARSDRTRDCPVYNVGIAHLLRNQAFVSPEKFLLLHNAEVEREPVRGVSGGLKSDVWSLASVLIRLLVGKGFNEELLNSFYLKLASSTEENHLEAMDLYTEWMKKVTDVLDAKLGVEFAALVKNLSQCLSYEPENRPCVNDVWRCIRGSVVQPTVDLLRFEVSIPKENPTRCLVLGELSVPREGEIKSQMQNIDDLQGCDDIIDNVTELSLAGKSGDVETVSFGNVNRDLFEGLRRGDLKSVTLHGHLDCITRFAAGGGFLFSSSFDKTVNMWSLQDFSHVQSLRGHEHRVTAVVVVDVGDPFCISGDSGGVICVWNIGRNPQKELLKKWYEHNDWRYTGVHSLAVFGTDYLYSGSGDKTIKVWSMQDYTLVCTMTGHKLAVSSLAICNGILYSGSWDGTVRLWWLSDHSPLSVLGEDTPGNLSSVLTLSVDDQILVAAYENGLVKMWKNNLLVNSRHTLDNGAIFALEKVGMWLFMGGWNKIVDLQEIHEDEFEVDVRPVGTIACDSVITALLYWQGKLLVGFSDKTIKAYYF